MKTIYFVRHGETDNNAARRFNMADSPLSEKGRRQAAEIAIRCESLPIAVVVSSTMPRALQTAEAVVAKIGKPLIASDLFIEGCYSTRLYGMLVDDPEAKATVTTYFQNFSKPGYRSEDGDNFEDLKKRSLSALTYLENRPEQHILVLTHAFFMWVITAAAVFGEKMTPDECQGIISGFNLMENTALTILTHGFSPYKAVGEQTSPWQLDVWNDHAHLADV